MKRHLLSLYKLQFIADRGLKVDKKCMMISLVKSYYTVASSKRLEVFYNNRYIYMSAMNIRIKDQEPCHERNSFIPLPQKENFYNWFLKCNSKLPRNLGMGWVGGGGLHLWYSCHRNFSCTFPPHLDLRYERDKVYLAGMCLFNDHPSPPNSRCQLLSLTLVSC